MRFGRGEYYLERAGRPSGALLHARIEFVCALDVAVPECRTSLEESLESLPPAAPAHLISRTIDEWAFDRDLLDDWLVDFLIMHEGWGGRVAKRAWAKKRTQWWWEVKAAPPLESLPYVFRYPPSDLSYETLDEVIEAVQHAVRKDLHANFAPRNRQRARQKGWLQTPEKRSPSLKALRAYLKERNTPPSTAHLAMLAVQDRHLYWLARFQGRHEIYAHIADAPYWLPALANMHGQIEGIAEYKGTDEKTVGSAVRELARFLRLTLRTRGKTGRPSRR